MKNLELLDGGSLGPKTVQQKQTGGTIGEFQTALPFFPYTGYVTVGHRKNLFWVSS